MSRFSCFFDPCSHPNELAAPDSVKDLFFNKCPSKSIASHGPAAGIPRPPKDIKSRRRRTDADGEQTSL